MLLEVLLILPLYVGISALFFRFRFRYLIKMITDIESLMSNLMSDGIPVDKRTTNRGTTKVHFFFSTVKSPLTIAPFRVAVKNAESALFVFDIPVISKKKKC